MTFKILYNYARYKNLRFLKVFVPRAGIEPARVSSLVFETNASTNSATWAIWIAKIEV
tara:strand:- start:1538 stop:1711 length:174 start_codon:yes stop_codon:yes gene_type:complete